MSEPTTGFESRLRHIKPAVYGAAVLAVVAALCLAKLYFLPGGEENKIDRLLCIAALVLGFAGVTCVTYLRISQPNLWTGSTGTISLIVFVLALLWLLGVWGSEIGRR